MATPKKFGTEKAIIISVSLPPKMKELIDKNHLSPSALLQEKILEVVYNPEEKKIAVKQLDENNLRKEINDGLIKLRKLWKDALKPENYTENQKEFKVQVELFLKKYSIVSKSEIYGFCERGNFFSGLSDAVDELNEIESVEPKSVYMDASKNKIKEINKSVD